MTKLLTFDEVRDQLAIGRESTYKLLREGDLPAVQLNRRWHVTQADVEHFIASRRQPVS